MSIVERILAQRTDATAVVSAECTLTYGDLADRVTSRAVQLEMSGAPTHRLDFDRGVAWIVDLLAAWEAQRVAVLCDVHDPPARRRSVLAAIQRAEDWLARSNSDAAYIAFTSGSSGAPSGCVLGARGLERMVDAQIDAFGLGPDSRATWRLSPAFDASLSDVLTALVAGARLHVHPVERGILDELDGLTHADLPPSVLPALLRRGVPDALRTIIFGGEVANERVVRELAKTRRMLNVYGPTETTVCSSIAVCSADWCAGDIGRSISGTRFSIREGGELWIGGDGVALEALDAATNARFVQEGGVRWYRTGDLVRQEGDRYLFLGRADRQVQLRGKRVQLEGVERVLAAAPGVEAVRVASRGGTLVAEFEGDASAADVDAYAGARLPEHERPRVRAAGRLARNARHKPASPTGEPLLALAREVLGREDLASDVPLGEQGIDSVDRLNLAVHAQAAGHRIEAEEFRDDRTLAELARTFGCRSVSVRVLAERALADRAVLPRSMATSEASGILITGAAGRLGRALLDELARRGSRRIVCLVRRSVPDASVECVQGDVALPNFGWSGERIDALRGAVGHVVHLAGAVDLVRSYDELRPVNVLGAKHALEVAARLGARLHHASTLAVFAESDAVGDFGPHDPLERAERVHGGYAQSKWVAEAIVRDGFQRGQAGTITRLGLLVPHAPGSDDQLSQALRGARSFGALPPLCDDALAFDWTPLSTAARALVQIVLEGDGTYHVASERPVRARDLVAVLELPTTDVWPPRSARTKDEAIAAAAFARMTCGGPGRAGDLFLATGRRFLSPRTTELTGVSPAGPSPEELCEWVGGVR